MPKRIESVRITRGGKGATVRRELPDGTIEPICKCSLNTDFSRGCIAQVPVELLAEAIANKGTYAPGNFENYKKRGLLERQKCGYCYANYRNNGNIFPRKVSKATLQDFRTFFEQEKQERIIRIGKLTEAGHPYYYQSLHRFLGLCAMFEVSTIFPTKMLPFGLEGALETQKSARGNNDAVAQLAIDVKMRPGWYIAGLLKAAKTTLMYSIGYNDHEKGTVSQGFTNEWRIQQAKRYRAQGVNVSLTLNCDITKSIEENESKGSAIKQALETRHEGVNLRLLPIRFYSKDIAEKITGTKWTDLVYTGDKIQLNLFGENPEFPVINGIEQRPYQGNGEHNGNHQILPRFFHPDFQTLIEQGIGVCGQIGDLEYCEACNICSHSPQRIVFPASEKPLIDYSSRDRKDKLRKKDNHPRLF